MTNTQHIAMHMKTARNGWRLKKFMPIESPRWSINEKSWIATLLETGDRVVTVGDTMYELAQQKKLPT